MRNNIGVENYKKVIENYKGSSHYYPIKGYTYLCLVTSFTRFNPGNFYVCTKTGYLIDNCKNQTDLSILSNFYKYFKPIGRKRKSINCYYD